jgi:hypothetical protein
VKIATRTQRKHGTAANERDGWRKKQQKKKKKGLRDSIILFLQQWLVSFHSESNNGNGVD